MRQELREKEVEITFLEERLRANEREVHELEISLEASQRALRELRLSQQSPDWVKTVLRHYLMKEEISKKASRFSEVRSRSSLAYKDGTKVPHDFNLVSRVIMRLRLTIRYLV